MRACNVGSTNVRLRLSLPLSPSPWNRSNSEQICHFVWTGDRCRWHQRDMIRMCATIARTLRTERYTRPTFPAHRNAHMHAPENQSQVIYVNIYWCRNLHQLFSAHMLHIEWILYADNLSKCGRVPASQFEIHATTKAPSSNYYAFNYRNIAPRLPSRAAKSTSKSLKGNFPTVWRVLHHRWVDQCLRQYFVVSETH